jgi:hypothetical protein
MEGSMSSKNKLELAKEQLEKVQNAWDDPDWDDLSLYGFYCLENAVCAAAIHVGINVKRNHPSKVEASRKLSENYNLPDVSDLLIELNDARKAAAYGDIDAPDLDAEDLATTIEEYVKTVEDFLAK